MEKSEKDLIPFSMLNTNTLILKNYITASMGIIPLFIMGYYAYKIKSGIRH